MEGIDMKNAMEVVKSFDSPVTAYGVKEYIWRPIQTAIIGKKSTTQLNKQEDIDKVYETICKVFGEMGIKVPPFPSYEELSYKND
jgi:hypothetical protein